MELAPQILRWGLNRSLFRNITLRSMCFKSQRLSDAYQELDITNTDCSNADLKEAYLKLVKRYHPDSGHPDSDHVKFLRISSAFSFIMSDRQKVITESPTQPESQTTDRYATPQHRQYLSYEGIGIGNPSQRQRQYQQARILVVNEQMHEFRIRKVKSKTTEIATPQIKAPRAFYDAFVEDLIQTSISKGDFENLSSSGKSSLSQKSIENPFVDPTTHYLNRMLVQEGFSPEWVTLQAEIRKSRDEALSSLKVIRGRLGPAPLTLSVECRIWEAAQENFIVSVKEINRCIDRFNLISPALHLQMTHIKAETVCQNILNDNSISYNSVDSKYDVSTKAVAHDIKSMKKMSKVLQYLKNVLEKLYPFKK